MSPFPARTVPDAVEVAKARAEYGEAVRALRAMEHQALGSKDPALRQRLGQAQDRVARAAARLSSLTGQRV